MRLDPRLGTVDETLAGDSFRAPVIFHLQDAHAVYEAQAHLAGIVESLVRSEKISTILVEGASGSVDLKGLRSLADRTLRKKVSRRFLKQGKISGEEYFQISSDAPVELVGIEDPGLYRLNSEVFLKILSRRKEALRILAQSEGLLRSKESEVWPSSFRRLTELKRRSEADRGFWLSYLEALRKESSGLNVPVDRYPQWQKFWRLKAGGEAGELNREVFSKELGELEEEVRRGMLPSGEALRLAETADRFGLLGKLFRTELVSEDYEKLLASPDFYRAESLRKALGDDFSEKSGELTETAPPEIFLRDYEALCLEFYRLARLRDDAFMKNLAEWARREKSGRLILITGGFHAGNLGRLLKREKIGRVLISPAIEQLEDRLDEKYARLFREKMKSALRMPATGGTAVYDELAAALRQENARMAEARVRAFLPWLDAGAIGMAPRAEPAGVRNELRDQLVELWNRFGSAAFETLKTQDFWIAAAAAGILGVLFYLWVKKLRRKTVRTEQPAPASAPRFTPEEDGSSLLIEALFEEEALELPQEEPAAGTPARLPVEVPEDAVDIQDPAFLTALNARSFFTNRLAGPPKMAEAFRRPELPMPQPALAIPDDIGIAAKAVLSLDMMLREMDGMDYGMRAGQKSAAVGALERALHEGYSPDFQSRFLKYIEEAFDLFEQETAQHMELLPPPSPELMRERVAGDIQRQYPFLPREIKVLLTRLQDWRGNDEITSRLIEIARKLTAPPPIAEDLMFHVQNEFHRMAAGDEALQQMLSLELPALEGEAGGATAGQLTKQLQTLVGHRGQLQEESEGLMAQIREIGGKVEKLQAEIGTVERPESPAGRAILDAYRRRIALYGEQLQILKRDLAAVADEELSYEAKEKTLSEWIKVAGERAETRIEEDTADAAVFAGTGIVTVLSFFLFKWMGPALGLFLAFSILAACAYALSVGTAVVHARKLSATLKGKEWPFRWGSLLVSAAANETKGESSTDPLGDFRVPLAAGVITFIALPLLSFLWGVATKRPGLWNAGSLQFHLLGLPFLGFLAGFALPLVYRIRRGIFNAFRYPFEYKALLMTAVFPANLLDDETVTKALRVFTRMSPAQNKAYVTFLKKRFGDQNVYALFNRGVSRELVATLDNEAAQVYRGYMVLEGLKKSLGAKYAKNDLPKKLSLLSVIDSWCAELDRRDLNGTAVVAGVVLGLDQETGRFEEIEGWMKKLLKDPKVPWASGADSVLKFVRGSMQFNRARLAVKKKFALTDEEFTWLNQQVDRWLKLFAKKKDWTELPAFLEQVLTRLSSLSADKRWFIAAVRYVTDMGSQWFSDAVGFGDILKHFDEGIGYKMVKAALVKGAGAVEQAAIQEALGTLEARLEQIGRSPAKILPPALDVVRALPAPQRVPLLEKLSELDTQRFSWSERGPPREGVRADPMDLGVFAEELAPTINNNLAEAYALFAKHHAGLDRLLSHSDEETARLYRQVDARIVRAPSLRNLRVSAKLAQLFYEKFPVAERLPILRLITSVEEPEFPVMIASVVEFERYYRRHPDHDYEHLPALLAGFRGRYGKLEVLTESLLNALTSPRLPMQERLNRVRSLRVEQVTAAYGIPMKAARAWDAVDAQEFVRATGLTKDQIQRRMNHPVVSSVIARMGDKGLQSYWDEAMPAYYKQFLDDLGLVDREMFQPGEKFRVNYDRDEINPLEAEAATGAQALEPVSDTVRGFLGVLEDLKSLTFTDRNTKTKKNYYDTVAKKFRDKTQDGTIEDQVTSENVPGFVRKLLADMVNWKVEDEELKLLILIRLHQLLFFAELEPYADSAWGGDAAEYWKAYLKAFEALAGKKEASVKKGTKYYGPVKNKITELLALLVERQKNSIGREGMVQFILTRGSLTDTARGEVSGDCTRENTSPSVFSITVGLPADPAFLSLKAVENGRWIGNVYAMLFVTAEGQKVVFLDQIVIKLSHRMIAGGSEWDRRKHRFAVGFLRGFRRWLAASNVQALVLSPAGLSLDGSLGQMLVDQGHQMGADYGRVPVRAKKPGGFAHQTEFKIHGEYLQGVGTVAGQANIHEQVVLNGMALPTADTADEAPEKFASEASVLAAIESTRQKIAAAQAKIEEYRDALGQDDEVGKALEQRREAAKAKKGEEDIFRALTDEIIERSLLMERLPEEIAGLTVQVAALRKELETREALLVKVRGREQQKRRPGPPRAEARAVGDRGNLPSPESNAAPVRSEFHDEIFSGVLLASLTSDSMVFLALAGFSGLAFYTWFTARKRFRSLMAKLSAPSAALNAAVPDDMDEDALVRELRTAREAVEKAKKEREETKHLLTHLPKDVSLNEKLLLAEMDIEHWEERLKVLSKAVISRQTAAGRKKIRALLDGLPEALWRVLRSHYAGVKPDKLFQLTAASVTESILSAWAYSEFLRNVVDVLARYGSFTAWFNRQPFYKIFKAAAVELGLKEDFDRPGERLRFRIPGDNRNYSLELSSRDAEYLLRGLISGDCTNCGPPFVKGPFITATGVHIAEPGFFNFKVLRDGEWIGNVYAMLIEEEGKPVLVVDAIQVPWEKATPLFTPYEDDETRFPVTEAESAKLAEGILSAMSVYAAMSHYQELWLSGFVSNFTGLKTHFHTKWPNAMFDRKVTREKKVKGWSGPEALGYRERPYVESINDGRAVRVWKDGDRVEGIRMLAARKEMRTAGAGYDATGAEEELVEQAIERADKTGPFEVKPRIRKIIEEDLGAMVEDLPEGFLKFLDESEFQLVRVKPQSVEGQRHPSAGLGVAFEQPGREVYTAFGIEPLEGGQDGYKVTFYVGDMLYQLASENNKDEIFAGLFYRAYRELSGQDTERYPLDIDLEAKINQEIERAEAWEARLGDAEREDLGLTGGAAHRGRLHVRARAFARFFGEKAADGAGTSLTALLRQVRSLRLALNRPREEDPALPDGAFDYLQPGYHGELEVPDFDLLFRVRAYLEEHKNEDLYEFVSELLTAKRRMLMLHTNSPSPWILKDIRQIVADLIDHGVTVEGEEEEPKRELKLKHIYLDLDPALQELVDQYLETGRSEEALLEGIAKRFTGILGPGMPEEARKEFERPDLYLNILKEVSGYNRHAGAGEKIAVHLYYPGRTLPQMPGLPGGLPGGMPAGMQGFPPMPPPGQFPAGMPNFPRPPRGNPPPGMPDFGQFQPGVNLPPLPGARQPRLPQGVPPFEMPKIGREVLVAAQTAIDQMKRDPDALILFVKPADEFSDKILQHSRIASVLHIDQYTGFGPEKPENHLALYMSEQASPNQKSLGAPIHRDAPFYDDRINPGVPEELEFNKFATYPRMILSTSGSGEGDITVTDDVTEPDAVPAAPAGGGRRAEMRRPELDAAFDLFSLGLVPERLRERDLERRRFALRRLAAAGEAALVPLVRELQDNPSLPVRAGILQALAMAGGPEVFDALENARKVPELLPPAEAARKMIENRHRVARRKTKSRAGEIASSAKFGVRSDRSGRMPEAASLYQGFSASRSGGLSSDSAEFLRRILKETPLVIDFDVSALVRKEDGAVSLAGWGFFEALRAIEGSIPGEIIDRISFRLINLNSELTEEEVLRALGITPELKSMVQVRNVPVQHYAYQGTAPYLRPGALSIVAESHRELWDEEIGILVQEPGEKEAIDGRKLFLTALLHAALRRQLPDYMKAALLKLMGEMGMRSSGPGTLFTADSESVLQAGYLEQLSEINRMLSRSA
ncbi:MAG: hypothetical protein WCU74_00720 [Candidatus Omnitrophota bacterium]